MISKHFILTMALTGAAAITVAEPLPSPIQFLESKGAEIVGTFDAPGGLKGYAARFRGEPLGIYLTADGEHAIVGTLLNDKGEEVSRKHLERLVAASPAQVDRSEERRVGKECRCRVGPEQYRRKERAR